MKMKMESIIPHCMYKLMCINAVAKQLLVLLVVVTGGVREVLLLRSTSIGEKRSVNGPIRVRLLVLHETSLIFNPILSYIDLIPLPDIVVDHFDMNREVVSIAMSHLDRFLDSYTGEVDKNLFQLLAMTCLYLSIKLNEYKHLLIPGSTSSMGTILKLSRGVFTLGQMEKMEYEVLQLLRWHVHPPTPQLFVKHFLFFLSVEAQEVHDLTQFMIELSVMDYFFVSFKPSEVAVASLLNALERLDPASTSRLHLSFLSQFVDIHSPNVIACRERLVLIYAQANDQESLLDSTPTKGNGSASASEHAPLQRTTSPVSVMAAPQPCASSYYSSSTQNCDGMEPEYTLDEDYDDL
jgi:hypothetical protein